MIDKLLGAILGFGVASMFGKKKCETCGKEYEKGGKVGDTVVVSTKMIGMQKVMGKIESLSPLKIRTSDNSVVVIPNSSIIEISPAYAKGGGVDYAEKESLKHFLIHQASSGMIANKLPYSDYKTIDEIRFLAIQILNRDGDRQYSMASFNEIIQEALLEYEENKFEGRFDKGGSVEDGLLKELHRLQRDLNSSRLRTYIEGDTSEEAMARQNERAVKLARFNEVLMLLREVDSRKYAQGGTIESSKVSAAKRLKIKNWYTKSYPTDDLGKEINDQISFWELYTYMSQGFDFYPVVNVYDSLVRERVFQKLSEILEVEYDVIYKMWLRTSEYAKGGSTYADGGDIKVGEQFEIRSKESGNLLYEFERFPSTFIYRAYWKDGEDEDALSEIPFSDNQDEISLEEGYAILEDLRQSDLLTVSGSNYAKGGSVGEYFGGMTSEDILSQTVVYDNGGKTLDRYTVFTPDGSVFGMSEIGGGFNQYVGDSDEVEQGRHLGKKLRSVPKSIELAVLDRMKEEFAKGGGVSREEMTAWKLTVNYGENKEILYGEPVLLKKGTEKQLIKWLNFQEFVEKNKNIFDGRSGVVIFPSSVGIEDVKKYHRRRYAKGGLTAHGLRKGDSLGSFQDNAVIVYPNNDDEKYKVFQVNLNKGIRMDALDYLELSQAEQNRFNKMARGGEVRDMFSKFEVNEKGNFSAFINNKNYEIIYRDDKTKLYDLFENNKKVKSSKDARILMLFPSISAKIIFKHYERNEDQNMHSENVVLLATHFGTQDELKKAKEILRKHNEDGSLSMENLRERQPLHDKLFKKLILLKEKEEIEKGGKTEKYELAINPFAKKFGGSEKMIQDWLQDTAKNSIKYKLAVLLMMGEKDPDEILSVEWQRYARLLRSLEKLHKSSQHEMSWRTENYTLNEAEKWTKQSLNEAFVLRKS